MLRSGKEHHGFVMVKYAMGLSNREKGQTASVCSATGRGALKAESCIGFSLVVSFMLHHIRGILQPHLFLGCIGFSLAFMFSKSVEHGEGKKEKRSKATLWARSGDEEWVP